MTALLSRNFPPAPKGTEILIEMPDLGKRTSSGEHTLYSSFLVLLYGPVPP